LKRQSAIGAALLALGFGGSCLAAEGQMAVVIHAGQMFDSHAARLVSKQVIVIQGDRIDDVGAEGSVRIPPGAEEIDLGAATVLPGLIEGHNHMFKVGDYPGSGADAVVPLEVKPGTPFSPGYITLLAAKNAGVHGDVGAPIFGGFNSGAKLGLREGGDVEWAVRRRHSTSRRQLDLRRAQQELLPHAYADLNGPPPSRRWSPVME
jgi:hypothetical protein